jgi:hypothetical protein
MASLVPKVENKTEKSMSYLKETQLSSTILCHYWEYKIWSESSSIWFPHWRSLNRGDWLIAVSSKNGNWATSAFLFFAYSGNFHTLS